MNWKWYNSNWKKRNLLTIATNKLPLLISNYPVYLDLSLMGSDFFKKVKNGGGDIRVTTSDGTTECEVEVVSCDTATGVGEIYFLAPALSSLVVNEFYIYYGNSAATLPSVSSTYGRNNVWSNGYMFVHHFQEASGAPVNSTGDTDYDGTAETNITYSATGFGGASKCFGFTAANASSVVLGADALTLGTRSIQAWLNITSYQTRPRIISEENTAVSVGNALGDEDIGTPWLRANTSGGTNIHSAANSLSLATWIHAGFTRTAADPAICNFYVNGALSGTANQGLAVVSYGNDITIGACAGGGGRNFDGYIDEIRVLSRVVPASEYLTNYNNMSAPNSFFTVGTTETYTLNINII